MSEPRKLKKNVGKWYCDLASRYTSVTGHKTYEIAQVINWAYERGELDDSPEGIKEFHARRLADALRQDTTDWNGHKVRTRFCTENKRPSLNGDQPKQQVLWSYIDDAPPGFLHDALWQIRKGIVDDIEALKVTLAFVNERLAKKNLEPIQMTLDFTRDDS